MGQPLLSTRDLAKLLDINVSTVKRWADNRGLRCVRTPGGHRRFRAEDVHAYLAVRGLDPQSLAPLVESDDQHRQVSNAILHRRWQWLAAHLMRRALEGSVREAVGLFSAMSMAGIHPADVCDHLITPAMCQIGQLQEIGRLTVADEHLACNTVIASLAEALSYWPARRHTPFRALCGSLSPDHYEIPCHCMHYVLRDEGWRVGILGANTPPEAFATAVRRHRADLVYVSATVIPDVSLFRSDCREVCLAAREVGSRFAIGGRAVLFEDISCPEGSFRAIRDMTDLMTYLRSEFRNGNGTGPPGDGAG